MFKKSIGIMVLALAFSATPAFGFGDWGGDDWGDWGDWGDKKDDKKECRGDWCDHKDKPVIPTPSAALAGAALIGGLAMRRRK